MNTVFLSRQLSALLDSKRGVQCVVAAVCVCVCVWRGGGFLPGGAFKARAHLSDLKAQHPRPGVLLPLPLLPPRPRGARRGAAGLQGRHGRRRGSRLCGRRRRRRRTLGLLLALLPTRPPPLLPPLHLLPNGLLVLLGRLDLPALDLLPSALVPSRGCGGLTRRRRLPGQAQVLGDLNLAVEPPALGIVEARVGLGAVPPSPPP